MSCYHPFLGIPNYDDRSLKYKICGPYEPSLHQIYPGSIMIPCGRCLGCRLDYSRDWADRMMLEFDHTKKAVFATLTYDDLHLPWHYDDDDVITGPTLCKEHFQLFMKRLRGRKQFEDTEIRFYASGEYGSKTNRPHYHVILFGISKDDFLDLEFYKYNKQFDKLYISREFEDIWQLGFCTLADVSWKTCAYVSRYVMKKATLECFPWPGSEPEFSLMSRRPGIGSYYLLEHEVDFNNQNITVLEGGKTIKIPKFFIDKLEKVDPDLYNSVKAQRQELGNDAALRRLHNTDLTYHQALSIDEDALIGKTRCLERSDI